MVYGTNCIGLRVSPEAGASGTHRRDGFCGPGAGGGGILPRGADAAGGGGLYLPGEGGGRGQALRARGHRDHRRHHGLSGPGPAGQAPGRGPRPGNAHRPPGAEAHRLHRRLRLPGGKAPHGERIHRRLLPSRHGGAAPPLHRHRRAHGQGRGLRRPGPGRPAGGAAGGGLLQRHGPAGAPAGPDAGGLRRLPAVTASRVIFDLI